MEQQESPYDIDRDSARYSPSVYTEHRGVSPDRPGTPSSFECYIAFQGGRNSATELSRLYLEQTKYERLTDSEEYKRAIYDASFLRAENAWLRRIRKSAMVLFEDTVQPTTELLGQGAEISQEALMRFHLTFGTIDQVLIRDEEAVSNIEMALKELVPAFELCREGLEKVRTACRTMQIGNQRFSKKMSEWNESYVRFFGIDYDDTADFDPCSKRQQC